jgi:predicted hydrolase (HD superfamily)
MENQEGRIDTPEIDTINKMMEKLIGGYSLISKAFMVREIAELKDRLDKASYEFGIQRDRIRALEEIVDEKISKAIEVAKIQIRGESTK